MIAYSATFSPDGRASCRRPRPDGTLYGTTVTENPGTIFLLAPDGSGYAVLHSFIGADGYQPWGELIQGPDGTLYGTTLLNAGNSNLGTVFLISDQRRCFQSSIRASSRSRARPTGCCTLQFSWRKMRHTCPG